MAQTNETSKNINLSIAAQYIKDLSFENTQLSHYLSNPPKAPQTSLDFDVTTHDLKNNRYEVVLRINATVKEQDKPIYLIDLSYAGAFLVECDDDATKQNVLQFECPRILFPAARTTITNITQDSGFPPLVLAPAIDFTALHHQKKQATAH
ncbi:MAG: protein-export chaperone SecB [Holosporaceae bacterium]